MSRKLYVRVFILDSRSIPVLGGIIEEWIHNWRVFNEWRYRMTDITCETRVVWFAENFVFLSLVTPVYAERNGLMAVFFDDCARGPL